uniref:Metalloendopeptidase n=1 Tax=Plectus sambesii TaxID=2011161 RepID=A0A914W3B6_9BILA
MLLLFSLLCVFVAIESVPHPNRANDDRFLLPADFISSRRVIFQPGKSVVSENNDEIDTVVTSEQSDSEIEGIASKDRVWPDGKVPYVLDGDFNELQRQLIANAVEDFHNRTCVKFVPKKEADTSFVRIKYGGEGEGCSSLLGRRTDNFDTPGQAVVLNVECLNPGTIRHELMHTLGFRHEQTRADRDEYVKIFWDNVDDKDHDKFQKATVLDFAQVGTDYDYGSVMHSDAFVNAKNRDKPTMVKKLKAGPEIGQRGGFSDMDILKINRLYNCQIFTATK